VGLAHARGLLLIEDARRAPMFHLQLFRGARVRAGNFAALLSSIGRGGLQFLLIIWLQGIWLPSTATASRLRRWWAGIYMLPLTAGFLIAGPLSGFLSTATVPVRLRTAGDGGGGGLVHSARAAAVDFSYLRSR